jgi:hypothetical protein
LKKSWPGYSPGPRATSFSQRCAPPTGARDSRLSSCQAALAWVKTPGSSHQSVRLLPARHSPNPFLSSPMPRIRHLPSPSADQQHRRQQFPPSDRCADHCFLVDAFSLQVSASDLSFPIGRSQTLYLVPPLWGEGLRRHAELKTCLDKKIGMLATGPRYPDWWQAGRKNTANPFVFVGNVCLPAAKTWQGSGRQDQAPEEAHGGGWSRSQVCNASHRLALGYLLGIRRSVTVHRQSCQKAWRD